MDDSDDYELLPKKEIDDLKRELSSVKKNSLVEGDKGKILIESVDKLTISINRLITILDDAQKDIIDEYQQAKPAEKMNKLLEQNEMIAKALLTMNDKLSSSLNTAPQQSPQAFNQSMQQQIPGMNSSFPPFPNQPSQRQMPSSPSNMNPSAMPPLDDFPPMGNLPPMDSMNKLPSMGAPPSKKKFLGFM